MGQMQVATQPCTPNQSQPDTHHAIKTGSDVFHQAKLPQHHSFLPAWGDVVSNPTLMCRAFDDHDVKMTPVGFEPTPLRIGALSQRLRPLGQSVLGIARLGITYSQCCSHWSSKLHVSGLHIVNVVRIFVQYDTCGVRTHALADWRLEPAP